MTREQKLQCYRRCYAWLLCLFPTPYHRRFGEGMEQTFNDILREQTRGNQGLFTIVLWMFLETFVEVMRVNMDTFAARNKNIFRIALAVFAILMVPLIAMQFTTEVNWGPGDFILMGLLLFGVGVSFELLTRRRGNFSYRIAVAIALVTTLLLVWSNLAVGIIGSEDNPANLLYFGVVGIGIVGAIIARFDPRGMAYALFAMALAQALIPVIAIIAWNLQITSDLLRVFVLNGIFVMMLASSALLFRRAIAPERT